ncbi:CHAT domain-containing protein [Mycena capillaripes]|nr:CHAT domain-containing protein [Mycena capillaripes]
MPVPMNEFKTVLEVFAEKLRPVVGENISQGVAWALWSQQEAKEYLDQFERFKSLLIMWLTADISDLHSALNNAHKGVNLTPTDHPDRAERLQCLAMCFQSQYERLGDLKDLEAALQIFQEAKDLTPKQHPARAQRLQNVAISFCDLYQRFGDLHDLHIALEAYQEALNLTPKGHPDRASHLQHFVMALQLRYEKLGDLKDLGSIMKMLQEALDLTLQQHPNRAGRLQSHALALEDIWEDRNDIEAALARSQEAPPDQAGHLQQLALSPQKRYPTSREPGDLAIIHSHYYNFFQTTPLHPQNSWTAALDRESFAATFDAAHRLPAYTAALDLLPEFLWIGHSINVQCNLFRTLDIAQTMSTAVKMCIELGELTSAVEIIERGIAIIFQKMQQLTADVEKLPEVLPDEEAKLMNISSELYTRNSSDSIPLVIASNKAQSGFENPLHAKDYNRLSQAAQGGPIIILNSHSDHCDGIIILYPTSAPIHVPLPEVTHELLKNQRTLLEQLQQGHHLHFIPSQSFNELWVVLLSWIWTHIVDPVYQSLESHGIYNGRIWWLPTGGFVGLPLHASPETDQFIHSYTATLGALLKAYSKRPESELKLGVVGGPQNVTHGHFIGVKKEVDMIQSIIAKEQVECLQGENATAEAVKSQLKKCSWAHIACQGKQDLYSPERSGLILHAETLELEAILHMSLPNAQFVFLSASNTAKGDSHLVNESFHLAGGFIAAGFRGAVGTLWNISDSDRPLVAEIFYSHLFRNGRIPDARDAAEALQLAVNKLKALNVPYERWVPFVHLGCGLPSILMAPAKIKRIAVQSDSVKFDVGLQVEIAVPRL